MDYFLGWFPPRIFFFTVKQLISLVFHGSSYMCTDNSLILHIYIIIRNHYHTYFELIHAFYSWFWNNYK